MRKDSHDQTLFPTQNIEDSFKVKKIKASAVFEVWQLGEALSGALRRPQLQLQIVNSSSG